MSTSYLPKLNPKVGKGLGGIPEKIAEGGGGDAPTGIVGNLMGMKVLNRTVLTGPAFGTFNLAIPEIIDIRLVSIELRPRTLGSSSPVACKFFIGEFNKTAIFAPSNLFTNITFTNSTTLQINNESTLASDIIVTEYDAELLFSDTLNVTSDRSTGTPLTNEILDANKTYISMYPIENQQVFYCFSTILETFSTVHSTTVMPNSLTASGGAELYIENSTEYRADVEITSFAFNVLQIA